MVKSICWPIVLKDCRSSSCTGCNDCVWVWYIPCSFLSLSFVVFLFLSASHLQRHPRVSRSGTQVSSRNQSITPPALNTSSNMSWPRYSDHLLARITPESSNQDVRHFITNLLERIDANITNERAVEMAEMFSSDRDDALEADKKEWENLFGEILGALVYERFVRFQYEYVDVSFHYSKVHVYTKIY